MPEKRQFFRGDVENAAVLAAFFASASVGSALGAILRWSRRTRVKKSGDQTNGQRNTMAGIGTAHLNRRQIAAPAGGRRFSRRCASRHWNNFKAPSPPAAVFGGTPAQVNHSSAYRKIISTVLSGPIRTTFPFPRRAKEKPSKL